MLKRVIVLTIILFLILFSILGFIYFFIVNNFNINQESGEISVFLKEVKEEVAINFSEQEDIFFNWGINEEKDMIYVRGKKISTDNATKEDREMIVSLLRGKEFKKSETNLIDGEEISAIGYRKNDIVCVLESNYDEGVMTNLSLLCGEIKDIN